MLSSGDFSLGSLSFDARSGELRRSAESRRLEPKAADVLRILCEHDGEVVTRQSLLDQCWGEGQGSDEALTQAVAQIRRAMHELGERDLIETLAKRGYRMRRSLVEAPAEQRPTVRWRRFVMPIGAAVLIAFVVLTLAAPHGVRHAVRHSLGFDTMSASPTEH